MFLHSNRDLKSWWQRQEQRNGVCLISQFWNSRGRFNRSVNRCQWESQAVFLRVLSSLNTRHRTTRSFHSIPTNTKKSIPSKVPYWISSSSFFSILFHIEFGIWLESGDRRAGLASLDLIRQSERRERSKEPIREQPIYSSLTSLP